MKIQVSHFAVSMSELTAFRKYSNIGVGKNNNIEKEVFAD
jgi:hypothetical protein